MTEADIPLRDQIAQVLLDAMNADEECKFVDIADALLREFEIYPRPGKEPRTS